MSIKPQWGPLCTHVASLYIYTQQISVGEDLGKLEPSTLFIEMSDGAATVGNSTAIP